MKVLVTGTSRGIGKAIAKKFLNENFEVVGIDILDSTIVHSNYTHIKKSILDELDDIADIDILINNAGVQNSNDDIDINLKGTINVTEKYGFSKNIKSIIFMGSMSATNGAEFPRYVASKGGVVSYMKYVAGVVAVNGATCNSVSAGGVITELNSHIISDKKLYDAVLNETLLHKWCSVEEIADLVYYLTVINKSITGQDIIIDNGELLKSNFIW